MTPKTVLAFGLGIFITLINPSLAVLVYALLMLYSYSTYKQTNNHS